MKYARLFPILVIVLSLTALAQNHPVPFLNLPLVPSTAAPGGAGFTLTVTGTGFISSSVVHWNNQALSTTFVSGSKLTATVTSADIATAGTATVRVVNNGPGGGSSNPAYFEVALASHGPAFVKSDLAAYSLANTSADLDQDGNLDLITSASGSSPAVVVNMGNGDGTFRSPVSYPVSATPNAILAADFNHDGKLDLVSANANGKVSVLLGHGDGSFGTAVDYAAGSVSSSHVVAADFNGDGNLDLAVANNTTSGGISILIGNGHGKFAAQVRYPGGPTPQWLAVGDFNNDGKLDLAVADFGGALAITLGNGDGTLKKPSVIQLANTQPSAVVAADFDGDGKLDLIVAENIPNTVGVFIGKGNGTFNAPKNYGSGEGASLVTADFNADGILDLATGGSSNLVNLLLGKGAGTFKKPVGLPTSQNGIALSFGDFNNDGMLDVGTGFGALLQTAATVAPLSLSFTHQIVGTVSPPKNATLTNYSGAAVNISNVAVTTNFVIQSNNCGTILAAYSSCAVGVSFAPTVKGVLSGTLSLTDDAVGSPQVVSLSGVAVEPVASLVPNSLTFPLQKVGTTSPAKKITLTNAGDWPLTITSIVASGDFAQTNTCPGQLIVGQKCVINVTFTPTQAGTRNGAITLTDDAPDSPQTVPLTGTGQ